MNTKKSNRLHPISQSPQVSPSPSLFPLPSPPVKVTTVKPRSNRSPSIFAGGAT